MPGLLSSSLRAFWLIAAIGMTAPAHAAAPRYLAETYVAKQSDSLVDLAVDLDLGFLELFAANDGVDPWLPGEGTEVIIPSTHLVPDGPHKGIIVNIGDQRLYYFPGKGQPMESWPIGIGREGFDIPLQQFSITAKRKHPTWVPTASMRAAKPELPASVGPGPDNPLGDYALNLGSSLYRIHGTNMPYGVGRRVRSGCIRMYPADIETLFNKVPVGTPVRVVNQPAKLGWIDGDLYLEVHPEGEQLDELEVNYTFEPQLAPEFEEQVARVAGDQVERVDWSVVVRTWAHRTGVPMRITRTAGEELIGEAPPPRVAAYPDARPGLDRAEMPRSRTLPTVPEGPRQTRPAWSDMSSARRIPEPAVAPAVRPDAGGSSEPARVPGAGVW
jgi:L,D-transpeptidase ErfK/SrfK